MFKKILIANRGEIAVRIARACRELGVSPVAVYSDADRASLHVRIVDEAVHIGPAPSNESYLLVERVLDAAKRTGAEAIHPGYGFLSENAEFADAVERSGLVLIGPPASAMRVMGSKTSARLAAQSAGSPIVPGTSTPLASVAEAARAAVEIGYPVMLKASAGGGGKGMRLVRASEEMAGAFGLAQAEAEAGFNNPEVYLEKYLEQPRHVEVQLIGDGYGRIVHLGERECSLQRRHQKVLEECPSPLLDDEMRREMGEAAVRIASTVGYSNAGTMEFLVDQDRNFYFLEMNTRLQVEHPITEMVTGRDLVHEQIRIAAGEPLSFSQAEVFMRGAAIECRIYAEDPDNNFVPSPGRITKLVLPGGPGVRVDTGVYEGSDVPVYYDPLLAKLCVWAESREVALGRLARALDEFVIAGIGTTAPFFRRVLRSPSFRAGRIDTEFIDRLLSGEEDFEDSPPARLNDIAAIAAVVHARTESAAPDTGAEAAIESRWKRYARIAQREGVSRR